MKPSCERIGQEEACGKLTFCFSAMSVDLQPLGLRKPPFLWNIRATSPYGPVFANVM